MAGEPVLPAERREGDGDQTPGHAPCREQHVYEGSEGHPDPGSSAGDPVCHLPLETREPAGGGSV